MKFIIISFVFMLSFSSIQAQISSGSFLLQGSIEGSFDYPERDDASRSTRFFVGTRAAYFLADNLALGLRLGYSRDKTTNSDDFEFVSQNYSFSPFLRKYWFIGDTDSRFAFLLDAQASIGFGSFNGNTSPNFPDTKVNSFSWGGRLSPAFAFFPTPKWGLELGLQGLSFNITDPNTDLEEDRTSRFSFGINSFGPSLGIFLLLN